jgi:hypothetical protein
MRIPAMTMTALGFYRSIAEGLFYDTPFPLPCSDRDGNQLNMVDEELGFVTRWTVSIATLRVRSSAYRDPGRVWWNEFSISNLTPNSFAIEMENPAIGKIMGTGLISPKVVGWEFRVPEIGFGGFEFYEKQEDGSYLMRAEYASSDQFRTLIRGKVWVQTAKETKEEEGREDNKEDKEEMHESYNLFLFFASCASRSTKMTQESFIVSTSALISEVIVKMETLTTHITWAAECKSMSMLSGWSLHKSSSVSTTTISKSFKVRSSRSG